LDRALNILEVLADRDESVGLTELARMMGLDSITVYLLLYTLRVHGYVQQGDRDKRYGLGPKAIELGQKALQKFTLRSKGAPFIRELAAKTGEAAHLVSLVGGPSDSCRQPSRCWIADGLSSDWRGGFAILHRHWQGGGGERVRDRTRAVAGKHGAAKTD